MAARENMHRTGSSFALWINPTTSPPDSQREIRPVARRHDRLVGSRDAQEAGPVVALRPPAPRPRALNPPSTGSPSAANGRTGAGIPDPSQRRGARDARATRPASLAVARPMRAPARGLRKKGRGPTLRPPGRAGGSGRPESGKKRSRRKRKAPWQWSIFPRRRRRSIVDATTFHCRVRDGNGWVRCALTTRGLFTNKGPDG